jgi:hypothetical protein
MRKVTLRPALPFVLALALASAPGCLVLSLHPAYDDESIAWEPALLGTWQDSEDNASIEIGRGEWRSYSVRYVYPAESGNLTGYLTVVGDERYLDLMPVRGQDRGSFLIPVHAVLRLRLEGDTLELAPLSYDWFFDRLRPGQPIPGLSVTRDQKENALIVSSTARLRTWLRGQAPASPALGAPATFTRSKPKG